jgi:hypothetical protein
MVALVIVFYALREAGRSSGQGADRRSRVNSRPQAMSTRIRDRNAFLLATLVLTSLNRTV